MSSAAITAVKPDTWPGTVTMQTSRSVTPAVDSDTSRNCVTKSSATGTSSLLSTLLQTLRVIINIIHNGHGD